MRQVRLGVAQRPLDMLALREIQHEGDAFISVPLENCAGDQHRHAAAVFAKVLFLKRSDGSSRLQLCEGLIVDFPPFGRRQLRPSQRGEIVPGISDNIEKGLVGFDNPALKIPNYDPDDVRIDRTTDPGLPFPELYRRAFSSEIAACDASSSSTEIRAGVNTCEARLFSR